jgi:hypothetical protein
MMQIRKDRDVRSREKKFEALMRRQERRQAKGQKAKAKEAKR